MRRIRPRVSGVEDRLRAVLVRMASAASRAGRDPQSVTLVGASKGVAASEIREAYDAGLRDVGENRMQEAVDKIAAVGPGPRWHLIGHLQSNKARQAARLFDTIHSIDSLKVAAAVDAAARLGGRVIPVLVEVNVAAEATKFGVMPEDVLALVRALGAQEGLAPVGLMTVAPLVDDPNDARPVFLLLRELRDRVRDALRLDGFRELSMGMSGDFEVAIEEGATIVRVGRAVFGHH